MHISQGFQQQPIQLPPLWSTDEVLKSLMQRALPEPVYAELDTELTAFQDRLAGPIRALGALADGVDAEPSVTHYDQWGKRVDVLRTSEGWRRLKDVAAEEGLVAATYERKQAEYSRLYSFAKLYMFSPDGRYVGCPYSMTDGCARVIEIAGTPEMKRDIYPRLISRDPKRVFTSGQWMTERPGGSDVSETETMARPVSTAGGVAKPGDAFLLDGFKWFSSATDGDVTLALARTGEAPGSRGLSLFLVKLRDENGVSNGVYIHRLKKKFGTKALPTAELSIEGAVGHLIGNPGEGVRTIATVLNITRLQSAVASAGALARALVIAKSFARVRHIGGAGGSLLIDNDLHTTTLLRSEVTSRALTHFVFNLVDLLGKSEYPGYKLTAQEEARLRLLTPVAKAFTSFLSVQELPLMMEALGGQGYMVENELGRLLQDTAVEKIWEGTTNVLALDVIRVITKSNGEALKHFADWANSIISRGPATTVLVEAVSLLKSATNINPRTLLFLLGHLTSAILLLDHALWSKKDIDLEVFKIWIATGELESLVRQVKSGREGLKGGRLDREIVYGNISRPAKL
ncbi:acyl-CoA dehydrogenase/oxidase C-terminal [Meredithblackwellia eburnea MCA 4105]